MNWRCTHRLALPWHDPAVRLLAAFCGWQFVLHLWQCAEAADPRLWTPHVMACLQDVGLLVAWLGVTRRLGRLLAGRARAAWEYVIVAGLFAMGVGLASYPCFLREYLTFSVNIFAADYASASTLVKEYLGLSSLWPVGVAAGVGATALALRISPPMPQRGCSVLCLLGGGLAVASLACPSPQPFVNSIQRQLGIVLAPNERVVPSLRRPPVGSDGDKGLSLPQIQAGDLHADHVLLIVLESVTSEAFEQEFLARNDGFYARVKDHAVYFNQYHATNLDSYTSLIAMLTSIQVPYRAYADERPYRAVNQARNLPRSLRKLGFRTLYICTCAHQPFVPTRDEWDRVLYRGDLPTLEGWLSLGSSRMEAATEDRAGLPAIEEFVVASPKSFVLDELVFGHTPEWRARTGVTQLAYYDTYLNDLLDRLEARDLAARSLLVIVSDHGDRAKASEAANYRVPLLIVGSTVRAGPDESLRSHLDLQSLVISYLSGDMMPVPRSSVWLVGSTERWVYGTITATGESLFIDDTAGRILSGEGSLCSGEVHQDFQAALDEFGRRFGR
jgi:hypothetical protein